MMGKYLYLFVGIFLLIDLNSYALPVDKSSEESKEGANALNGLFVRFKLIAMATEDFNEMRKVLSENGIKTFKSALEDPALVSIKTKAMTEEIKLLQKMLKDVEDFEMHTTKENESVFDLLQEFAEVVENYTYDGDRKLTDEEKALEVSLKKHGFKELQLTIFDLFGRFNLKFNNEIEKFIGSLNEKEKKNEDALITWFEKFKAVNDPSKKLQMFVKSFDMPNKA